tara:strand:+ start:4544 stop:4837 length:294 start_codon:yes stop_codon:yes gene_type:complete
MSDPTINEKSHFKISLPMAIQAIGLVLVLVYGYRDLESRIRLLEVESEFNTNAIKEMEELQEKPIPSDIEQNQRLKTLEAITSGLNDDVEFIKRIIY